MKTRMALSLGFSTLILGMSIAGITATATASDRSGPASAKAAAKQAEKALAALSKHQADQAVRFAEFSVALLPRDAGYRMILGQSYLQAGRFVSARTAFADVLALTPGNGKAALNLALAQTATGDWDGARKTLDTHGTIISTADLGLAMALAGDPVGAVRILTTAAREPGAGAKVRQNLALALALSGQWNMARAVAAADLSPADVDARMEQWAAFAQPHSASDQVATLLGVKQASDAGLPMALALNGIVPVVAATNPVAVPAPVSVPVAAPTSVVAPVAVTAPALVGTPPPLLAKVVFAPSREIIQAIPVTTIQPVVLPNKVAVARVPTPIVRATGGDWVVQLGAYQNAGVAKDGWARAARRFAGLHGRAPTGTSFAGKAGSFYRLSVNGFARGDADRLCRTIHTKGGACFVRKAAGDQMAQWLRRPGVQLAAR